MFRLWHRGNLAPGSCKEASKPSELTAVEIGPLLKVLDQIPRAGRHPIRFRVRLLDVGLSIATKCASRPR